MSERAYSALALAFALLRNRRAWGYEVLLCADSVLPPSPWTAKFRVEIDHNSKVIRLSGDFN